MYVFGGEDSNGNNNEFFVLDLEIFQWERLDGDQLGQPPEARSFHAYTMIPNSESRKGHPRMAIFGGYTDKGFSNDLIFFDIVERRWERPGTLYDKATDLPTPR